MSGSPTEPAPWFLEGESPDQLKGPYTSKEITELVMDGALKLESRIFDSAANAWKIAADVVPYLNLGAEPAPHKGWNPPPRPVEFKDVHVVELDTDTDGIDYFALIGHRTRELERIKTAPKSALTKEGAKKGSAAARPTAAPAKAQDPDSAHSTEASKADKSVFNAPASEGILSAEVERAGGPVVTRIAAFARGHRRLLAMAAATAFVCVGTYSVVRTLIERRGREPATAAATQDRAAADRAAEQARAARAREQPSGSPVSNFDSLGSGANRIARPSGNVSNLANRPPEGLVSSQPQHQPPPQPTYVPPHEPAREPPQYYSSSDDPAQNPQVPNSRPAVPPEGYNPNDPNDGTVQPPGYMSPNQSPHQPLHQPPEGTDPNRYPTGEPNN